MPCQRADTLRHSICLFLNRPLEQNPNLTTHELDKIVGDYTSLLQTPSQAEVMDRLRKHERTGRAAGSEQFIGMLETKLGKSLRLKKPGRKPS